MIFSELFKPGKLKAADRWKPAETIQQENQAELYSLIQKQDWLKPRPFILCYIIDPVFYYKGLSKEFEIAGAVCSIRLQICGCRQYIWSSHNAIFGTLKSGIK